MMVHNSNQSTRMAFNLHPIIVFIMLILTGCGNPRAERVILDTDMGSDCDDVGALALLHHYAATGRAEILGVIYSSGAVPYGAGVVDAINHFYDRSDIPVGACHDTTFGDPVDKMNAEVLAKNSTVFGNEIVHNLDAPEQTTLNRKLLAAQPDGSVTYITIGHTRGLYELLISSPDSISGLSGRELIERKVKRWVALGAMGSANSEGHRARDWNFFFNGTAGYTDYLVTHFPVHMEFVDGGSRVFTGGSLRQTPPGNIVRLAYKKWLQNVEGKQLQDQRPSWDLVTVLYAIEGSHEYFDDLGPGLLDFDPINGCLWSARAEHGKHRMIRQKEGTDAILADYLNQIISGNQDY